MYVCIRSSRDQVESERWLSSSWHRSKFSGGNVWAHQLHLRPLHEFPVRCNMDMVRSNTNSKKFACSLYTCHNRKEILVDIQILFMSCPNWTEITYVIPVCVSLLDIHPFAHGLAVAWTNIRRPSAPTTCVTMATVVWSNMVPLLLERLQKLIKSSSD